MLAADLKAFLRAGQSTTCTHAYAAPPSRGRALALLDKKKRGVRFMRVL